MSEGSLFSYLPWWGSHSIETERGLVSFVVLVDGTCAIGMRVDGKDLYASDNDQLNQSSDVAREIVNRLPPNAFLQTIWDTTTGDFSEAIDAYEARASEEADPILKEQRTRRAQMFRADKNLARGTLTFWIGIPKLLSSLSNEKKGLVGKFLGKRTVKAIEASDLHAAGMLLSGISEQVFSMLESSGYRAERLSEELLIKECYRSCNPGSSTRLLSPKVLDSAPDSHDDLESDELLFLRPLTLREQIPNGPMTWNEDCFVLDDPPILSRVLGMQRPPSSTTSNLLRRVQDSLNARVRLVITHVAQEDEKIRARLKRQRDRMESQASLGRRDINAEVSQREHEVILEKMLTQDERVFATSIYLVLHANTRAHLDRLSDEAMRLFADAEVGLATQYEQQLQGWVATLPGNGYRAPKQFRMLSRNAADFTLLHEPAVGDRSADLLYHNRRNGIRKVSIGEGKPDKHALIFGGSGSGKSFHVSTIIQSALAQKQSVSIVDVQGPEISSYRRMTELFGGKYYALSSGDVDVSLNPFPSHEQMFSGDEIDEDQLSFLKSLIVLMASPDFLSCRESTFYTSVAQSVIQQAYIATEGTGRSPTVSDIVACLKDFRDPQDDSLEQYARTLYLHLREWINDKKRARLLNRPEAFEMNATFSVFDFYGLKDDPHLATVLLLVCANLIWNQLKGLDRAANKLVVFDEAWALIQNEAGANLLQSLYRTARKFNGSIFAISQSANDILNTPVKDAIVNNTSTFFLQKHSHGFDTAAQLCGLNAREEELLRALEYRSGEYADCLMVDRVRREAAVLRLSPTPFDLWLNTTNPADMAFREKVQRENNFSLLETIRELAEQFPRGAPNGKAN